MSQLVQGKPFYVVVLVFFAKKNTKINPPNCIEPKIRTKIAGQKKLSEEAPKGACTRQ
jgi:hypothetical protein